MAANDLPVIQKQNKQRARRGEALHFYNSVVRNYAGDDCLIWPFNRKRYGMIRVGRKIAFVHRLVCEEINGPPPTTAHEAAHSCGNGRSGCVNPHHLVWKTHAENMQDAILHGVMRRGELSTRGKLKECDVRIIRNLKGKMRQADIARKFGVTSQTIYAIHKDINWRWLD